jgi:hypothetical protein
MRSIKFDELQHKADLPRPVIAKGAAPAAPPAVMTPVIPELPGPPPPSLRLDPVAPIK